VRERKGREREREREREKKEQRKEAKRIGSKKIKMVYIRAA